MYLSTAITQLVKLFSANASGSSFTTLAPTATEPTGDGVITPGLVSSASGDYTAGNNATFAFYGTRSSADNETFTARITGWKKTSGSAPLYIPFPLLDLNLVQGTSVGVALSDVLATEYFADQIAASTAFTTAYEIINPANNRIALVKVDAIGCCKLQVQLVKGTNATCNVLGGMF